MLQEKLIAPSTVVHPKASYLTSNSATEMHIENNNLENSETTSFRSSNNKRSSFMDNPY